MCSQKGGPSTGSLAVESGASAGEADPTGPRRPRLEDKPEFSPESVALNYLLEGVGAWAGSWACEGAQLDELWPRALPPDEFLVTVRF